MPDPHTLVHTQNFSLEGVNAHYTMADVWVNDGCFFVVISAPVPTADTGNDDEDEDGDGKPTHSSSSNSSATAATVVRSDCRRPGMRDVQPDNQMLAFIVRPRPKTTTPIVSMTSHMSLTMTEIPWQTACRSAAGSRWYDDDDDDPVENESSDIGTGTNAGDDAAKRDTNAVFSIFCNVASLGRNMSSTPYSCCGPVRIPARCPTKLTCGRMNCNATSRAHG